MIYEMLRGVPCFHGDDLKQTYQRVLYGELRFLPEDKFSPPARELISGLLRRDPRERLGSCSGNPLQEIQACTFFRSVDWDALLLRSRPGPWVPPSATSVSTSVEREKGKGAPHPHPALCGLLEDVTESENGEEDENLSGFDGGDCSGSHSSPLPCSDYPPPSTCSPCLELSCTERASDLSEALTVNDSIIATGDRPTDPNRLPRWSFMDDDSLRHMTHRTIPR
jgi:serine/threonine protein kinase